MCVHVCACVCLVVWQSIDKLKSKGNEKKIDTNRGYMFLICPVCVWEGKDKIMDAVDICVTNV